MSYSTVSITAGSGTAVGVDAVASTNYQIVKLYAGKESSTAPIGHIEDDAHTSADAGIMALAVRKDTAASTAGTDGDYCPLISDSTGRLHVNVGNTVTVGSHAVTNAGTFAVQADSVIPGTGATNLGKAEDAVHGSGDTGVMALAVRKDTAAALAGADGDYAPLEVDANGCLHVLVNGTVTVGSHAVTNAGTFAVQAAQSGTWNIGTVTAVTSITNTVTVAGTGTFAVQAACTNAGTFAVQESGAALTALQLIDNLVLAEDAVHGTGDPGVQFLTVRKDTAAATSGTDGDYQPAITDANGRLHVIDPSAATIATNTGNAATSLGVMDDWDNAASDGASVSGDVAHDSADAGEPVKIGAKATTSMAGATLVADADRVNAIADTDGALITRPYCPLPDAVSGNATNTDGSSTQVIAAQAANVRTYITTAILTNTSASNGYVELKDGTTVMATIPIPANGGCVVNFPVPLKGTAATAWNYDPSAALNATFCTLVGFKSKV